MSCLKQGQYPHYLEEQESLVRQELRSYVAVSYFDTCSIDVFQQQIKRLLQSVLAKSALVKKSRQHICKASSFHENDGDDKSHENTGFVNLYNSNVLVNILRPTSSQEGIDWSEICSNHDELCKVSTTSTVGNNKKKVKYEYNNSTSMNVQPLLERGRRQHNTTLEEVIQILLDPTVIPYCCSTTLILVFLRILVFVPRSTRPPDTNYHSRSTTSKKWSPSRDLILNSIIQVRKRCPSACPNFAKFFCAKKKILAPPTDSTLEDMSLLRNFDCGPLNQLASTMQNLSKGCPKDRSIGTAVIQCLLEAIKSLDDVDVKLLKQNSGIKKKTLGRCPDCHLPFPTPKNTDIVPRKRQKRSNFHATAISNLHDTNFAPEKDDLTSGMILQTTSNNDRNIQRIVRPMRSEATSKQFSMEQLMLQQTPERTCECHSRRYGPLVGKLPKEQQEDFTKLTSDMVFLRCKIYRKVVSTFILLTMSCNIDQRNVYSYDADNVPRRELDPSNLWLLRDVLHKCYLNPQSPSIRLCVALLADSIGDSGLNFIIKRLWQMCNQKLGLYSEYSSDAELLLRIYSEIVVECSTFDNGILCWGAFKLLLSCIEKICDKIEDTDCGNAGDAHQIRVTNKVSEPTAFVIQPILRCASYLMRHRSNVLLQSTHEKSFRQFLMRISVLFHDPKWWILADMSEIEQDDILHTLQALGVLSFVDRGGERSTETVESRQEYGMTGIFDTCIDWPFRAPVSLRSTHDRMGPRCGNKDLLSSVKNTFENLSCNTKDKSKTENICHTNKQQWVTPIMDHLHDDVLSYIFSFMNYKRLVQVRRVCKVWKSLADSNILWYRLYTLRHNADGAVLLSAGGSEHGPGAWKSYFINKLFMERTLRFRRSPTGFKHRVCGYTNCDCVLKTQAQQQKHYTVHLKKIERAKIADQRKREKEAKAEAMKKQKTEKALMKKQILQQRKEMKAAKAAEAKKKRAEEREWLRVVKLEEKKWEDEVRRKEIQTIKDEKVARANEGGGELSEEQVCLHVFNLEEEKWEDEVKKKEIEVALCALRNSGQDSLVNPSAYNGRVEEDGEDGEDPQTKAEEDKITYIEQTDTASKSKFEQFKNEKLMQIERNYSTDSNIGAIKQSREEAG